MLNIKAFYFSFLILDSNINVLCNLLLLMLFNQLYENKSIIVYKFQKNKKKSLMMVSCFSKTKCKKRRRTREELEKQNTLNKWHFFSFFKLNYYFYFLSLLLSF